MRAIPLFRGARLNDCAKASNTVSAGKDGRGDSGGGAGGSGLRAVAGYAYDMAAGSVESGQTAGKISGVIPVFENPPPNVSVSQELASWEGNLIGIDAELALSVRHRALDALLSRGVYSEAFAFGKADLTKALRNSGLADKFRGPRPCLRSMLCRFRLITL